MAGSVKGFTVNLASNGTFSSSTDFGTGAYSKVYLEIPTFTSSSDLFIQCSSDDSTYRRVGHMEANTASVAYNVFRISGVATNCAVQIPLPFRYAKVEVASLMSINSGNFVFMCSD